MRSTFRDPAHQLAVRMLIAPMAIIIIMAQATSHAPCASNCACAEGLHFSAFHFNYRICHQYLLPAFTSSDIRCFTALLSESVCEVLFKI